jgi:hypothetical protein
MKKHHAHNRDKAEGIKLAAKEFAHHDKNHFWYIGIGLMVLAGLYISLINKDYLLMAVVLAVGIALFRLANLKPDTKKVELGEKGVYWGDRFFPYHKLRSFWVAQSGDHINIYLDQLNFAPTISLTVPDKDAERAAYFLANFLPYHHHKREPFSDRVNRLLKL